MSATATACPCCGKEAPAALRRGSEEARFRCAGCGEALRWMGGRVGPPQIDPSRPSPKRRPSVEMTNASGPEVLDDLAGLVDAGPTAVDKSAPVHARPIPEITTEQIPTLFATDFPADFDEEGSGLVSLPPSPTLVPLPASGSGRRTVPLAEPRLEDAVASRPSLGRDLSYTPTQVVAAPLPSPRTSTPRRRGTVLVAVGGAVLVLAGAAVVTAGVRKTGPTAPESPLAPTESAAVQRVEAPRHEVAPPPTVTIEAEAKAVESQDKDSPVREPQAKASRPKSPAATVVLDGKKVVVEFDSPAGHTPPAAPPPADVDARAVDRAREAYLRGNSHLFAGKPDAAIDDYRDSLKRYSGYVAGYRGLGLAFEQKGKKAEAIDSFTAYLHGAPAARDADAIRRRMRHLQTSK